MNKTQLIQVLSLLALGAGCGSSDNSDGGSSNGGGNEDAGDTGGNNGNNSSGGDEDGGTEPTVTCPKLEDRETVTISGKQTKSQDWTCDKLYLLADRVYVTGGATLSIGPGTIIQGSTSSALFITNDGKIDAQGTAEQPIVFTSYQDVGMRAPSDWQGVILLGKAPINRTGGVNTFEGLDDVPEHRYGGSSAKHDCGTLKYVRIEFAGYEILPTKEVNGLTLAGCGSDTTVDYLQVHMSADDGVEFFGGNANISHYVGSSYDDDGLDWDEGYSGKAQFIALQQPAMPTEEDPNGFEGDNQRDDNEAKPVANPTIYNATMIGGNSNLSFGMVLRRGMKGTLKNLIIQGFKAGALDVKDPTTGALLSSGDLTVSNAVMWQCGGDGKTYFENEPLDGNTMAGDDDGSVDEKSLLTASAAKNAFANPKLGDADSRTKPDFVPAADSPAADDAATPPDDGFFDNTATYRGAFEPGGDDWTAGWTSFPKN